MPTINQLSSVSSVSGADQIPIYDASNGDARKASVSVFADYMQANLSIQGTLEYANQYASPSTTGFTVTVRDSSSSVWLLLTPTAGFATGSIVLPSSVNCINNQELLVNCTQQVSTLTIDGNGATVTGKPSSLGADDFFRLKYDAIGNIWYRVG